jgi:hypothetical protein
MGPIGPNVVGRLSAPPPHTPQILGVPMLVPEFQSDTRFLRKKNNDNPLKCSAQG